MTKEGKNLYPIYWCSTILWHECRDLNSCGQLIASMPQVKRSNYWRLANRFMESR